MAAQGDAALPGPVHLPALYRRGRNHPALLVPGALPVVPVVPDHRESSDRGGAVLPDARVTALAGGPGTPRPGTPGGDADGSTGHEAPPRAARTDLSPYEVVAQEKTPWWAPFGKQYVFVTVFLLVVMVLGYGGIVYGGASQVLIFLTVNRGYGAGFVFAMTA